MYYCLSLLVAIRHCSKPRTETCLSFAAAVLNKKTYICTLITSQQREWCEYWYVLHIISVIHLCICFLAAFWSQSRCGNTVRTISPVTFSPSGSSNTSTKRSNASEEMLSLWHVLFFSFSPWVPHPVWSLRFSKISVACVHILIFGHYLQVRVKLKINSQGVYLMCQLSRWHQCSGYITAVYLHLSVLFIINN